MSTTHPHTPILIIGGGPIGSLLSLSLSHFSTPCTLIERSLSTTPWPKMEQINSRTMEILRMLGLAEKLRKTEGVVAADAPWRVLHVTGLGDEVPEFARVDTHLPLTQERILDAQQNNGTRTSTHHQRTLLTIFESFLKGEILSTPLISSHYGLTYTSHVSTPDLITTTCLSPTGHTHIFTSTHLIACDGAGSRVRRNTGIKLIGGALAIGAYLVHFTSPSLLSHLTQKFGRFWHINIHGSGFLLDQDEKGTFTVHNLGPHVLEDDVTKYDPEELVFRVLGGVFGRAFRFSIERVLVHSAYRPNIAVAERFISGDRDGEGSSGGTGRVLLCGDSAHRQPPHGGLGFNSGAVEQFALAFALSAVVKGYGDDRLLRSYAQERKFIVLQNLIHTAGVMHNFGKFTGRYMIAGPQVLEPENEERKRLAELIPSVLAEKEADGVEFDRRLEWSRNIVRDRDGSLPPVWDVGRYTPTTSPGCRVPHVWLKDSIGEVSTFDLFDKGLTLLCFAPFKQDGSERVKGMFEAVARERGIPLEVVVLRDEEHVREIWEGRDMVLVRPDGFSLWRSQNVSSQQPLSEAEVRDILDVVLGFRAVERADIVSTEPTEEDLMARLVETLKMIGVEDTDGGMGAVEYVAGFQVEVE